MSSWIYLPLFVSLSSLCILLIICHTGMSNRITDKQADCSERPPETWRCCSKSETKLPGSQTAAHFTTRLTISLLRFLLFLIYGLHLAVFLTFFSFITCSWNILDTFTGQSSVRHTKIDQRCK